MNPYRSMDIVIPSQPTRWEKIKAITKFHFEQKRIRYPEYKFAFKMKLYSIGCSILTEIYTSLTQRLD